MGSLMLDSKLQQIQQPLRELTSLRTQHTEHRRGIGAADHRPNKQGHRPAGELMSKTSNGSFCSTTINNKAVMREPNKR